MKRIGILITIILFTIKVSGQGPFGSYEFLEWAPGESIGLRYPPQTIIQGVPVTSPLNTSNFVSSGSMVNFSVVFSDIYEAKCLQNINFVDLQFRDPEYEVKLTSNHPDALFNGMSTITLMIANTDYIANPLTNNDMFAVMQSEVGKLNISLNWNQSPITVTMDIIDISSSNLAIEELGNPDDLMYTKSFTLNFAQNCPTSLIKIATPPEGMWVNNQINAIYEGKPLAPPNYQNYIISEEIGKASAANLFTISDLDPSWLSANPDVVDEMTAVDKIFPILAHSASFAFDNLNQFEDEHSGLGVEKPFLTYLSSRFKTSALQAGKAGYLVNQTYYCGQTNIGEAVLTRRYIYSSNPNDNFIELKKTHNF